tara:strand:- start:3923 stop:5521 length:1599 start_codon:yes stop_codon:yes gene_type:complete
LIEWAEKFFAKIETTRRERVDQSAPIIDNTETLLKNFHPDYAGRQRRIRFGPNAQGCYFPLELADLLEADSPLPDTYYPKVDIETDVLIIGGGGAGTTAALELEDSGLMVHLASKLRLGDSNTIMAEGGIQAALGKEDSPRRHFADAFVGGHGKNDPGLLRLLCEAGPNAIRWLVEKGCMFDQNSNGTFRLRVGGGTSVPRVLACRDYTGLEIMRVLRDALRLGKTQVLEKQSAVELLDDGYGNVSGAVLWNSETKKLTAISSRAVFLATGGSGQMRLQGFSTSNHFGSTGDGLPLVYRQGCFLMNLESYQYHPSGACYPDALAGQLLTEGIRAIGAQILNLDGERFVNELTYRDVVASAIIRECEQGRGVSTPLGLKGVWLDTPLIDLIHGEGTVKSQFPGLMHRFERYGIRPDRHPLLIYPTLHYQNGGVRVDGEGRTERPGLWAAGEVSGGLHGTNRLMGNSLLDIIVFARRAAESICNDLPERKPVGLSALKKFRAERRKFDDLPSKTSPQLYPTASKMKIELLENTK